MIMVYNTAFFGVYIYVYIIVYKPHVYDRSHLR